MLKKVSVITLRCEIAFYKEFLIHCVNGATDWNQVAVHL